MRVEIDSSKWTDADASIVWSRAHRKSKNGCNTCKARKVKCDEHRPVATTIHGVLTDSSKRKLVPRIPKSDASSARSSTPPLSQVVDIYPIGTSESAKQRGLEMKLLHHYTTITSHGLPSTGKLDTHRIFFAVVPQVGFVSDIVLDAMLAFSAFHLRSLTSPSITKLKTAESHYMSKVLKLQRSALQNLKSVSSHEVCLTALFIFHYIWLAENQLATCPSTPYYMPTRIFHLGRGSIQLSQSVPDMGVDHHNVYCPRTDFIKAPRPNPSTFIETGLHDLASVSDFLKSYAPPSSAPLCGETEKVILREAIKNEEEMINFLPGKKEDVFPAAYNMFPLYRSRNGNRFEEILDEGNEVAMGLLARIFAAMYAVGRIGEDVAWWLYGEVDDEEGAENIATGHVLGIRELLGDKGRKEGDERKWDWIMEWPVAVVEGKVKLEF